MSSSNWKQYFDKKAEVHGASVKSSDYFDDESFFMQRDNTLRWLGESKGKVILDAGCGVGAFSEPLVKQNTVYGVDFSEKSLEFAAGRGLQTSADDLTALHFEAGKFDVVLCIGVIQLIEQYKSVIGELARVTKPGGTLLIQTLNKGSLQRKVLRLFEKSKKFDKMYAMDELKKVFEAHGFEQIQFLNIYHPFKFVTTGDGQGLFSNTLSTSFAIKGRKKID
ncbi:methyltransferase domain-containing protein [Paenibacillus sp. LMG 31456]|uniref:Methyltransferase domain-containing protein n=1 Tax=Paenibacillus foliorum TaxID=2654974 RepID=A0A972H0X1_9BACL|nr:class I SAM-dependent methyltransferase [Paenibacillus foliorum]NOU98189.1 methyltransferase domain-containing protein [Paenibacillus foliorum]